MNKNLCCDVTIAIVRVYVVNVNVRASMRERDGKTRGGSLRHICIIYRDSINTSLPGRCI